MKIITAARFKCNHINTIRPIEIILNTENEKQVLINNSYKLKNTQYKIPNIKI